MMSAKQTEIINNLYSELLNSQSVNIRDKERAIRDFTAYMLIRAQQMIRIKGLPETMPEKQTVRLLQTRGYIIVPDPARFPQLDGLYPLWGGLGGEYTPYYTPSWATVANPYLKPRFDQRVTIWSQNPEKIDGVIIRHDPYYMGLMPLITRYATMLAEVDISMLLAIINVRTPIAITAPDDRSKDSADMFFKRLEEGRIETIASEDFISAVKGIPITAAGYNVITQLIELKQYLRAGLYNDLGINSNYNMKRESINSVEAQLDDDALRPLVDEILDTMQSDFDIFNDRFGTDVTVELGSAWQQREAIAEAELDIMENEAEGVEEPESPAGQEEETEKEEPEKEEEEEKKEGDS